MVKYLCDICGGFEVSSLEYRDKLGLDENSPTIKSEAALRISYPAIKDRPAIEFNLCGWCWKDSITKTIQKGR